VASLQASPCGPQIAQRQNNYKILQHAVEEIIRTLALKGVGFMVDVQ